MKALELSYRIRDLDPLSPRLNLPVINSLLLMQRYDEAIEAARATIELAPEFPGTHSLLAEVYYRKRMYNEWFASNIRASELAHEPSGTRTALIDAYRTAGVRGYWQKVLELLQERSRSRSSRVSPITLAGVYAELGETDRAFECLERAYAEREPNLVHLKTSPTFDPLRSDPRYAALLKRMKL